MSWIIRQSDLALVGDDFLRFSAISVNIKNFLKIYYKINLFERNVSAFNMKISI